METVTGIKEVSLVAPSVKLLPASSNYTSLNNIVVSWEQNCLKANSPHLFVTLTPVIDKFVVNKTGRGTAFTFATTKVSNYHSLIYFFNYAVIRGILEVRYVLITVS